MDIDLDEFLNFASSHLPLTTLTKEKLSELAPSIEVVQPTADTKIYKTGDPVKGLYIIKSGAVDITSQDGQPLFHLTPGDTFGKRALLREGKALDQAIVVKDCVLYLIPAAIFKQLLKDVPNFNSFFNRGHGAHLKETAHGLASTPIADLMTRNPVTLSSERSVKDAALTMQQNNISCVPIVDGNGTLVGIVTNGDLVDRILAADQSPNTSMQDIMTRNPITLAPQALGFDALLIMAEKAIKHLPIVENNRLVGVVTTSNLVRKQTMSPIFIISDIKTGQTLEQLAEAVSRIPELLSQLVASGMHAHDITRIITTVADTLTVRLIEFAEQNLGPAPVPYLWLACGSQGRHEQTGVSDQDNCIFLDDAYVPEDHSTYFEKLAQSVSDGLNACGYYYCPGDMMATNPKWCQPVTVWRQYFKGWIDQPDPMAQMLSSVMFDLRPIAGETKLFEGVQAETLTRAQNNSIFRAHMISNSLKHTPPLSLFRGFALIRRGEHKDTIDLKHNGIVPIVDLARVYALEASIEDVNTRARLKLAHEKETLSKAGFRDILDAYDLISTMRLHHQADQIRNGQKPDNFMPPSSLSDLQRSHLREAFTVVKTLQSALSYSHGLRV